MHKTPGYSVKMEVHFLWHSYVTTVWGKSSDIQHAHIQIWIKNTKQYHIIWLNWALYFLSVCLVDTKNSSPSYLRTKSSRHPTLYIYIYICIVLGVWRYMYIFVYICSNRTITKIKACSIIFSPWKVLISWGKCSQLKSSLCHKERQILETSAHTER